LLAKYIKKYALRKQDTASPLVSLAKSISWRLLGTIDTILISWFITGETTVALSIGAVEVVTKNALVLRS